MHLGTFTRDHDAYATVIAWHQMIEAYIRDSGVAWTNLHPNIIMQSFLAQWSVKGAIYNAYTSKAVGFTAGEDVAEAAAVILTEGQEKHNGKDYWFSADVLAPDQVAETLTAATALSSQPQFAKPKASKTMPYSLVPPTKTRMQRADSNCLNRSRTEEWRTLEA